MIEPAQSKISPRFSVFDVRAILIAPARIHRSSSKIFFAEVRFDCTGTVKTYFDLISFIKKNVKSTKSVFLSFFLIECVLIAQAQSKRTSSKKSIF